MQLGPTEYDISDIDLADKGVNRIEWAGRDMPVLNLINERFKKEKPLEGQKIAACLHVTSETANLAIALNNGGAEVFLCASNPISTQDDVAAALVKKYNIPVFAKNGEDTDTYYQHLNRALDMNPTITMDDGADLVALVHSERQDLVANILGGSEETTTGIIRLKSLAKEGKLQYPVIAVNDADTKHLFDNRYGTGQSVLDGITRATNILWAGKTVVVVGYGWCGRGVAMRSKGMGARVIVTEFDPVRALEAYMDGHTVMSLIEAAPVADVLITVTGDINAIGKDHLPKVKDGAILANAGHFNVEIDIPAIKQESVSVRAIRDYVEEYTMKDGRKLFLLAEGRLINLAAAEGHPSAVMDLSFADQALAAEFLSKTPPTEPVVYDLPQALDKQVARLKLESEGIFIDAPTEEQKRYLSSWDIGT